MVHCDGEFPRRISVTRSAECYYSVAPIPCGRPSSPQYTRWNAYPLCPANGRDAKSCVSTTTFQASFPEKRGISTPNPRQRGTTPALRQCHIAMVNSHAASVLPVAPIPCGRPSSAQYTRYNTYALCSANGRDAKSCVSTTTLKVQVAT